MAIRMILIALICTMSAEAAGSELTMEGAARHPTVFVTPEDVERARRRIAVDPDARAWLASIKESAAVWADKSPAWVREVMPDEGACFAYGFTGCPLCGSRWGTWGSARAALDRPGTVQCTKGHILPDEKHPDTGTGYTGADGRVHYFVGSYNAWVVETLLFKIAKPHANIYLLEGDARAGRMAALILDQTARIYPSCDKGSWDYPSNPPSGRLNRPWYQVARVLVHYVDIYDRIFDHPALDEPSSVSGLTRRQNIEKHLLLNGAKYCHDMSVKQGGLHNGQADYLRGVLAVGVVLGIPEYITWPVDGPYGIRAMLANNVDRDGRYFETSASYAWHTRNLYLTFTEPLLNYRGSVYPDGLNLYDEPKFESFLLLPQMALVCLGHNATFGDMAPVWVQRRSPYVPPTIWDCRYTEYLATRCSDARKRAEYTALLTYLRGLDVDADQHMADMVEWRVFHESVTRATEASLTTRFDRLIQGSFFFGQKGLAVLRRGQNGAAHGAILRFGPSLVHGHYDDLNVNYYARGYDMSYDLGYSLGSTHTQVGWAKQTVSHNTLVVDETSQGGGAFGGSLHHFAHLSGVTLAEASSTVYAHTGVDVYRRLIALVDEYALDLFRARGGRKHDLPIHSLGTDVIFDNVAFDDPRPGSLAGAQHQWGTLQLNDGDMKGFPNKPYWNPPPGNGYGFLVQPRLAAPRGTWAATWRFDDANRTRFRLLALHEKGTEVVTAMAPGLYPHFPKARHVIRRRAGAEKLSSCFVSLWQTFTEQAPAPVASIDRIDGEAGTTATSGLVLRVCLADGRRDYWCLVGRPDGAVTAKDGPLEIAARGAIARVRLEGSELVDAQLLDATSIHVAGWCITLDTPQRAASIVALPEGEASLPIGAVWPGDGRYDGDPLYVDSSRYTRNAPYVINRIDRDSLVVRQAGTILGRGVVDAIRDAHTLITRTPHEYARSVRRQGPSGFFEGKLLRANDGSASTHIRDVTFGNPMAVRVESTEGFRVGQPFRYHDVQPGDRVTVHHYVDVQRTAPDTYALRTNADVTVTPPEGKQVSYVDKAKQLRRAVDGRIVRGDLPPSGTTTITTAK